MSAAATRTSGSALLLRMARQLISLAGLMVMLLVAGHLVVGIGFSPVVSRDMEPTIAVGDLQVWSKVPSAQVNVGDVVIVTDDPAQPPYPRRVVSVARVIDGLVVQTKGDAVSAVDSRSLTIPAGAAVSVVRASIPYVGRPLATLDQNRIISVGWLLLFTAGLLYLISVIPSRSGRRIRTGMSR